jgi:hypothetical protein
VSRPFRLGFFIGLVLGIAIAFIIDFAFRDYFGGTWFDAVSHDLSRLLGRPVPPDSPIVLLGVTFVIMFIGLIGELLGGLASKLIFDFLDSLDS